MLEPRARPWGWICRLAIGGIVALVLSACFRPVEPTSTPRADPSLLETRVESKLRATLTAKAPTPQPSATPTAPAISPTPTGLITPTPNPTATPPDPAISLAFVDSDEEGISNIVFYDKATQRKEMLTRFVEQQHFYDITYSWDGQRLGIVSSHDFMHSRDQEHNVFFINADGTGLQMVTGDYADPEAMPAPYVTLVGQVTGGQGTCQVSAQGTVSQVEADEEGGFELSGVSTEARWARAICQDQEQTWQGSVGLSLPANVTQTAPISIPVGEGGRGWRQIALSPDNEYFAGVHYRWEQDPESEERVYRFSGQVYDLVTHMTTTLQMPEEGTLMGLAWSPITDTIVGSISAEESTSLWRWHPDGRLLGPLFEISNTEQAILSIGQPAFSPNGRQLAFELRRWNWWGESEYRTDLVQLSLGEDEMQTLFESSWGTHATHPSWSADSKYVFYNLSSGEPGDEQARTQPGQTYHLNVNTLMHIPWISEEGTMLPAVRPIP